MDGEFPSGAGGMGGAPQEEDYTKMNLEDRLSSKVGSRLASILLDGADLLTATTGLEGASQWI
jgi:hypothetical protein